ncbi:hypothetical protein ACIOWE_22650 [Pseudomonas sp. NPDC087598]|uniref:hypothetical protein n=1 Tax=Pseudomonas sp. NPDC087598 TaxID=3364440 RepID=UPI0037FDEDFC
MNLSKSVIFFSLAIPVAALFSLSASAEEAKYKCIGVGKTGTNPSGEFIASSLEDAVKQAIKAFGPITRASSVSCIKQ